MPLVERVEYGGRGGVVIGVGGCRVLVGGEGRMGEGGDKRGEGLVWEGGRGEGTRIGVTEGDGGGERGRLIGR